MAINPLSQHVISLLQHARTPPGRSPLSTPRCRQQSGIRNINRETVPIGKWAVFERRSIDAVCRGDQRHCRTTRTVHDYRWQIGQAERLLDKARD